MEESLTRVHGRYTFSRRNGKTAFEGYGRSGQSCVHGEFSGIIFLSVVAEHLCRNTTFEIQRPSKKAFDIRTSFTILLDGITPPSVAYLDN